MHGKYDAAEIGNAVSAVLVALMQTLVDRNILSSADIRQALTGAARHLGPHDYGAPVKGAIGIILNDIMPQFPDTGGD